MEGESEEILDGLSDGRVESTELGDPESSSLGSLSESRTRNACYEILLADQEDTKVLSFSKIYARKAQESDTGRVDEWSCPESPTLMVT